MTAALQKKLEHLEVGILQGTMPSPETIHSLFKDIVDLLVYVDSRLQMLEQHKPGYMEPRGN